MILNFVLTKHHCRRPFFFSSRSSEQFPSYRRAAEYNLLTHSSLIWLNSSFYLLYCTYSESDCHFFAAHSSSDPKSAVGRYLLLCGCLLCSLSVGLYALSISRSLRASRSSQNTGWRTGVYCSLCTSLLPPSEIPCSHFCLQIMCQLMADKRYWVSCE
jgi:hypothetical protein